jgi:hypothetical protein
MQRFHPPFSHIFQSKEILLYKSMNTYGVPAFQNGGADWISTWYAWSENQNIISVFRKINQTESDSRIFRGLKPPLKWVFFIVCILLCVTNIWQGKVSVNITNVVLQSINTQIEFNFLPHVLVFMGPSLCGIMIIWLKLLNSSIWIHI